jgi:hypothetical protein
MLAVHLLECSGEEAAAMNDQRPTTLVWIDSREAIFARWNGSSVRLTRVESEVPGHRRSTGHVQHDPTVRPGGGGGAEATGEPHRLHHLGQFLKAVASRIRPEDHLVVIGPGQVRERLVGVIAEEGNPLQPREIRSEPAHRLTNDQLRARVRELAGVPPRRRKKGIVTGPALRVSERM